MNCVTSKLAVIELAVLEPTDLSLNVSNLVCSKEVLVNKPPKTPSDPLAPTPIVAPLSVTLP